MVGTEYSPGKLDTKVMHLVFGGVGGGGGGGEDVGKGKKKLHNSNNLDVPICPITKLNF